MSEHLKQNVEATERYLSFIARTEEQILDGVKKTQVTQAAGVTPAADLPGLLPFPAVSPR